MPALVFRQQSSGTHHEQILKRHGRVYVLAHFFILAIVKGRVNAFDDIYFNAVDARLPFFFEFVTDSLLYILATIATVCAFFPIYVSLLLLVIFGKSS